MKTLGMKKIISYPLSIIYYALFYSLLLVFHPIQWICFNLFGYEAHKKSVDLLNFFMVAYTYVLGTTYKFENLDLVPQGVPLIIAANHQSMYDIAPISWFMRRMYPKFISKIELGKGIPSISYNLNHGGSVLIDRNNPRQSLPAIKQIAEYVELNKRSVVIFPEGTRSKTGIPKPFAENGLKILCKYAPSAYIVPLTINNSWKMTRWGSFPLGVGNKLTFTIHPPMAIASMSFPEIFEKTEKAVTGAIRN